eukprot:CAMPEP_0177653984 /NCGR_PEP_ID=MMETSP0447-20121125/14049_1 /TAXON_ID=0 /ORGANISM="Stygamoeba regulata, Strain BSH-02190019" /LENGTH=375 /DNA_ID=CAMNT_0019157521 /DNA_START=127 /DNA_END=1254 /DNA_ORIENTATION=-
MKAGSVEALSDTSMVLSPNDVQLLPAPTVAKAFDPATGSLNLHSFRFENHVATATLVDALKILHGQGSKLKALILDNVKLVRDEVFYEAPQGIFSDLESISWNAVQGLGDKTLEFLAVNCPRLHSLCMSFCTRISEKGLEKVGKGCPALATLILRNCNQLGDAALTVIGETMGKTLTTLNMECLSRVTPGAFAKSIKQCVLLRELHVRSCVCLTVESVIGAFEAHGDALRALDMSDVACDNDLLGAVATVCPNLERLWLGAVGVAMCIPASHAVSDVGLETALGMGWKGLKDVRIARLDSVTEAALVLLVDANRASLEEFEVAAMPHAGKAGHLLSALAKCTRLRIVNLFNAGVVEGDCGELQAVLPNLVLNVTP